MKHINYAFLSFPHLSFLDSWVSFCFFGLLGVYCLVSILSLMAVAFMMVLGFIGHYIVLGYLQEFIDFPLCGLPFFLCASC